MYSAFVALGTSVAASGGVDFVLDEMGLKMSGLRARKCLNMKIQFDRRRVAMRRQTAEGWDVR